MTTLLEPALVKSPLEGVGAKEWTRFVRRMGAPECAGRQLATGHLGLFLLSPARLARLGLVTNLRRVPVANRLVWEGDFVPPLTAKDFLRSPNRQYQAFAASMRTYAPRARTVSAAVDGAPVSLSGALAVAHRAGLKGLLRWVRSAADRAAHPFTTATFYRVNGVF